MKNKKIRNSLVLTITILLIGICIIPISNGVEVKRKIGVLGNPFGNMLYVGGSGSGNYSTIQEAIDDAVSGDTVFVFDYSSPYQENIRINKQIFVIGENRDTTEISGISGQDHAVRISSKNSEINGFTIIGAADGQDGIGSRFNPGVPRRRRCPGHRDMPLQQSFIVGVIDRDKRHRLSYPHGPCRLQRQQGDHRRDL